MKPKVIFIVGPTGVGKTDLALNLALKFKGDLVSADSVQVFKNLDIISGKDIPNGYKYENTFYQKENSPSIYLLDQVMPTVSFNVFDFHKKASDAIQKIQKKGKHPVVVGGTGLYVESILDGLDKSSEPDHKLREELDKLTPQDLQRILPKAVLDSLNDSDRNNKRRLIRQIEKANSKKENGKIKKLDIEKLVIGLKCDREVLKKRINARVDERLNNGALEEAKSLFVDFEKLTQQVKDANGYKQLFKFLNKEITFEEAVYRWKISEYRHAKNQMTWFQKYGNAEWFDINNPNYRKRIDKKVKEFLL